MKKLLLSVLFNEEQEISKHARHFNFFETFKIIVQKIEYVEEADCINIFVNIETEDLNIIEDLLISVFSEYELHLHWDAYYSEDIENCHLLEYVNKLAKTLYQIFPNLQK